MGERKKQCSETQLTSDGIPSLPLLWVTLCLPRTHGGFITSMHHIARLVRIYHQGPSSSGSGTAPHSPPTPAPFLGFEQARGIHTTMCSLAGSLQDLPRCLEVRPTMATG